MNCPLNSTGSETCLRARASASMARILVLATALALAAPAVFAVTFRYANQGDALSMDPHSLNEGLQLSTLANVYEGLVARGRTLELTPGLATDWEQTSATVWRFNLRRGVTFHDGTPFTAADVIFSWQRSRGEGSDMKSYVQPIAEIHRVDHYTIDIVTSAPYPILPDILPNFFIMSQKWCEANHAEHPVDKRKGVENEASFKANGTGPFELKAREPGARTTFVRNPNYWGKADVPSNVDEAIFVPIGNSATRVAALLSGEVQMMEPVPVQDVERIATDPRLKVLQGPELRTLYLGMDQSRDELLHSSVKGKNPFKDRRVRQAFYQAIDVDAIQRTVMHGASTPSALMIAPPVRGWTADLNKRLPYDADVARRLLADAGYGDGFEVELNCPNDRFVNDAAICTAVTSMLARIGIRVSLVVESKATYFPKVISRNTSFYLASWTPTTIDAHDALNTVMATPDGKSGRGQWNLGSWSNARFDALVEQIASESDPSSRLHEIEQAMQIHQDEIGHIPLHQQALSWGLGRNVDVVQRPDNFMLLRWIVVH
jgi:peptide/nickel transport system substrate-binding protein